MASVCGGKLAMQPIRFMTQVDKATPQLFATSVTTTDQTSSLGEILAADAG